MDYLLPQYFSLQYDSKAEYEYIQGLQSQFELALESESYHLALFAYHLLFLAHYNQVIHKMHLWIPEKFSIAVITFGKGRRDKFLNARNPSDYADKQNSERGQFDLLSILGSCDGLVKKCKDLVDFRNHNLGHVNYNLISDIECKSKVEEYDIVAEEIHLITQEYLKSKILEFAEDFDTTLELTTDVLEIEFIKPNWLSERDIQYFSELCESSEGDDNSKLMNILEKAFGKNYKSLNTFNTNYESQNNYNPFAIWRSNWN